MTEEEKKIHIDATKQAVREWLAEEKDQMHKTVGLWFINALTVALVAAGMYLILWFEKHKG